MPQFGFTYDALKCVGCHACAVACKAEFQRPTGVRYRQVIYTETGTFAGTGGSEIRRSFLSTSCYHCEKPGCLTACPSGALQKDPLLGLVTIDPEVCIGCRRCAAGCPYGAPQFNAELGKTEKCTGCRHRLVDDSSGTPVLRDGIEPACVEVCPAGALGFVVKDSWGGGTAPGAFYDRTKTKPSVDFT
jgi:anaerobic dimethyl sulfoxide reductase subunit B (iron-sulfur subunit)